MTGGIAVATTHGPCAEDAVNHTPPCTPYHSYGETRMIGIGELNTYISEVSGIGFSTVGPSITGTNVALARYTFAVCGISLAMSISCACGVPGIEAFTFSLGLSSGIRVKSAGKSLAATYCHGPSRPGAPNHRPVTSTYVLWVFRSLKTFPVVFCT